MKSILLTLLITLVSSNVFAGEPFLVFSNSDALQKEGAKPFFFGTSHFWFDRVDGKYITDEHSVERTKKYFPKDPTGPIVINIEVWSLNEETRDEVYRKMLSVTDTVRELAPGERIGWYRMLPKREYWLPIKRQPEDERYQAWQKENRANIDKFGHLFDYLAPSVYSFNKSHGIKEWSRYANANLEQCVYARKQVYAYVWPMYHNTSTPVPDELWRQQLRFLRDHEHCDGIFIFHGSAKHDWQTAVAEELLSKKSDALQLTDPLATGEAQELK